MKRVNSSEKELAIAVVYAAFKDVEAVTSLAKADHKKEERVKALFNFCINVATEKEGAFLTDDKRGVALLFKSWKTLSFQSLISNYFHLMQQGIGWSRAPKLLAREFQIRKRRKSSKHLYFWLLGFDNEVRDIQRILEIRDFCFTYSKEEKLPIVAETTSQSALKMYMRYGFKVYDTWTPNPDEPTLHFIARDWNY
jgi:hypothetical protein